MSHKIPVVVYNDLGRSVSTTVGYLFIEDDRVYEKFVDGWIELNTARIESENRRKLYQLSFEISASREK